MSRAFKRLERVLKLEASQGYKNKAVVGGIRQFVTFWVSQAREETVDELDVIFVEQASEALLSYGRLTGVEKRQAMIEKLLRQLADREKRAPTPPEAAGPPVLPDVAGAAAGPAPESAPPPPARERRGRERTRQETPAPPQAAEPRERPAGRERAPRRPPLQQPAEDPALAETEAPRRPQGITRRAALEPDPEGLRQNVTKLKGVGPQMAAQLANLGATTIADLLYTFPRRYDDYTQMKAIQRLQPGEQVTIIGTIWQVQSRRGRNNTLTIQAVVNDGTGAITAQWYNQRWLMSRLSAGMQIALSGTVDQFLGRPVMHAPEWEPVSEDMLKTGRIVPIYPLTQGLGAHKMRSIMQGVTETWAARLADSLPEAIRAQQNLLPLTDALYNIHLPENQDALHQARERLAFDELLLLQLGMQRQRQEWRGQPARAVAPAPPLLARFMNALPYELTGAQQRVSAEIAADMSGDVPMTRLLQGDVGAGKTVVAAAAMVLAAAAGGQAALMAPTGILAEQHYQGLAALLEPLGLTVRLLTGATAAGARQIIYDEIRAGAAQVVIGTHALIQETVQFNNLILAVIDEQHRFGVDQRRALRERNGDATHAPHLLAMSATPIPRTLALSLYGDLDVSVLDEMPPGRQEIKTYWVRPSERERAYAFVRGEVAQGRQAFVICPLVEESDKIEAKAAVDEYARLQRDVFPNLRLGLVHGRLSAAEKEAVMRDFHSGACQVLVSTSVIEVGVDVPNSSVMVIEGANRFGLAQLHQFRGRVGRGEHPSHCLLIADETSADAEQRLTALEQTNDGFLLAEKDLELRGPGQFFGTRQSGLPELRLASLLDVALLQRTRAVADEIIAADADLAAPVHAQLREQVDQFWASASDAS